jgi:hypothetical protein
MSIIRTLTAVCDIPDCGEILVLNPDDSQPFLAVADAGWNVFATWDDVATICPRNHEGTEAGSYCLLDGAHDWWALLRAAQRVASPWDTGTPGPSRGSRSEST